MRDQQISQMATIFRSAKRTFTCKLDKPLADNTLFIEATALGNILKKDDLVVGDRVEVVIGHSDGEFVITNLEERKNEIYRIILREGKKKVTAANVDYLVIVVSATLPAYKAALVDRYLLRSFQWGIPAILVFNKMDEFAEEGDFLKEEEKGYNPLLEDVIELSAFKGDSYRPRFLKKGIKELKEKIKNKKALFVGHSGVGKSHLISTLTEGHVKLKNQELAKANKGKHTTTWSEIIEYNGYSFIDSPGIRSFSLDDLDPRELIDYFPDLFAIARTCRFSNCQHQLGLSDNTGCSFYEYQNDIFLMRRLDSYKQIEEQISTIPFWKNKFK